MQRWKKEKSGDKRQGPKISSNQLSSEEKNKIISLSINQEFKDLSPRQIVPILADRGKYYASESSFYRVLKENNLLKHRLRSKPKRKNIELKSLKATSPNQLWSWDITYLKGNIKGKFYYLYMIMDIFSRKIIDWIVHENESSIHSSELIKNACRKEKICAKQLTLHSDNGSPMKGATMLATLQKLGVVPTFSRPSVSDDNPFSESLFKTLKYCPTYPEDFFDSLDKARKWSDDFTLWYNHKHLHSEIKYVTPCQRHEGLDEDILENRMKVYEEAKKKNSLRWSGSTRNWNKIMEVRLKHFKVEEKV